MNLLKPGSALVLVALVLGAAGCSESSGDAAITSRVKSAISKEAALRGTSVDVSTEKKVVHLSGTVKSRAERAMLIAVARKVEGVQAVRTDLVVQQAQPKTAAKPQAKPVAQAKKKTETQRRVAQREPDFYGR